MLIKNKIPSIFTRIYKNTIQSFCSLQNKDIINFKIKPGRVAFAVSSENFILATLPNSTNL